MIERLVNRLGRGGVTEVVLALGFKPEPFIKAFPNSRCGDVKLTYAVEPAPLDTGGAIKFAANKAGIDGTFVVANGDVLTDLDVEELVAAHRRHKAEATLHLTGVDDPSAFGVVALGDGDRITDFVEKPALGTEPSNLINAGTYVFEPSVLDRIPDNERVSVERSTFPLLAEAGRLYGHATPDYWIDAGRPDLYRAANLDLLDEKRSNVHCEAVSRTANVDTAAMILNSIIGDGAVVAPGARIVDSVLLPGAQVGSAATIEASLVMGRVGDGARVDASMVGVEGVVPDGAAVTASTVPEVPAS
jgi:mannose-1-phosphate guanylyltransferase